MQLSQMREEHFLSKMQYGFLIRDSIPINNVASPIKLAEYLSCGISVIISKSLYAYADLVKKYNAGIVVEQTDDIEKVMEFNPNHKNSLHLYKKIYDENKIIHKYENLLGMNNK